MRRHVLLCAVLVIAAAAPFVGTAAAAQEQVTLDVQVINQQGETVGGAVVNATWDGGSATGTTTSSGRTLIDVPRGEDVSLQISDETYTRNFPKRIGNAQEQRVTVEVARKGSAVLTFSEEGDESVQNATVFVRDGQRVVVKGQTNSAGRFSTGTIERGDYTLIYRKGGYFRNETSLSVTSDIIRPYEMRQGSVNVEFQVSDDHFDDPRPVTQAAVTVEDVGTQRTTAGRVTFTVPVNTRQGISVTKEGYETVDRTVTIGESNENVRVNIQRTPELNLTAESNRVLVGNQVGVSVLNAYDEPVNGATITRDGEALGAADSAGGFRFRIESAGNHTIRAETDALTSDPVIVRGLEADEDTPTSTPTATPSPTTTPTETSTESRTATPAVGLPGFTPAVAVLGLLLAALLLRRRD